MRLQQTLEKYLPLIGNMLAPALFFAVGLFYFLLSDGLEPETSVLLHWIFYFSSLTGLIILLYFNQSRPLFFMAVVLVSYILINYLKMHFGTDFRNTLWYQNLTTLAPLTLLMFYLYGGRRFISRYSLVALTAILVEYSLAEILGRAGLSFAIIWYKINWVSVAGFGILVIWALSRAVKKGALYDYSVLFASLSLGLGFYFADTAAGISLFFFMAQVILLSYIGYTLVYNYYFDDLTGCYSRKSYLLQSKYFPLKYSLAVVNIDNYGKLSSSLGRRKMNIVISLIAKVIQDMAAEENIYRYAADQFIILYKKLDKKETFAAADNIRRTIAGLSFATSATQKPFKLTVSCGVSEKKRSDSGTIEVLMRADKALRKTSKFSNNVTSQA